jgi:hypothetical protein
MLLLLETNEWHVFVLKEEKRGEKEAARQALAEVLLKFGTLGDDWAEYTKLVKAMLEKYFEQGDSMKPKKARPDNIKSDSDRAVFLLLSPDPERGRFLKVGVFLHLINLQEAAHAYPLARLP